MKKIIAAISALVLVSCIAVVFYGCGAKDEPVTTDTTTEITLNDGVVTDDAEIGDNGVIGDIVTDVSEDVSEIVTDVMDETSAETTKK